MAWKPGIQNKRLLNTVLQPRLDYGNRQCKNIHYNTVIFFKLQFNEPGPRAERGKNWARKQSTRRTYLLKIEKLTMKFVNFALTWFSITGNFNKTLGDRRVAPDCIRGAAGGPYSVPPSTVSCCLLQPWSQPFGFRAFTLVGLRWTGVLECHATPLLQPLQPFPTQTIGPRRKLSPHLSTFQADSVFFFYVSGARRRHIESRSDRWKEQADKPTRIERKAERTEEWMNEWRKERLE